MTNISKQPKLPKVVAKDSFTSKMETFGYQLEKTTGFFERKINDISSFSINKEVINNNCILTFSIIYNSQFALLNCSMTTAVVENDIDKSLVDQMEKFVMSGMEALLKQISLTKEEEEEKKI